MVPWHLQPQYLSETPERGGAEVRQKKMNKKQRARRRRRRKKGLCEGEGGELEEGSGEEEVGEGEVENKDSLGHVTTKGGHMSQGFQTFLRYYHVFRAGELSALFNEVGGVRVLE